MTTPRGPQPFAGQEKRLRLLAFVRQDSIVRVDKRVEDTAMVWPHLLVIEFIAAMLWSIGLFVIAAAFNAPLQDHANPDCTPNPSKAPWYLLNLQELLQIQEVPRRLRRIRRAVGIGVVLERSVKGGGDDEEPDRPEHRGDELD